MATASPLAQATVEDLYKTPGKAEIVGGELRLMPPTGALPGRASLRVVLSLSAYAKRHGRGEAVGDCVGFLVNLPHRRSFSPDAAWWTGADPGMKFYDGAPDFAVEVRSEGDYGPAAERDMAAKRIDYFAAGTRVVWDVDMLGEDTVRVYSSVSPDEPHVFRRGDVASAEPAVPGWTLPVDELFAR